MHRQLPPSPSCKLDLIVSSECDGPSQGHDRSVDIWSVGMLTLQLFLGYEELPGRDSVAFKSQDDIDTYLDSVFAAIASRGKVSDAGKSFICSCLAYDSWRRPTARQAFCHLWLQEPESDRKLFKRLDADNALSWKPQQVKFPVIEHLKAHSAGQNTDNGDGLMFQDTKSPHFMAPRQSEPAA